MREALTLVVGALTAITLLGGIVAAVVRLVLLPWLREHLVEPMKENSDQVEEVHRQVTVNQHTSPEPTVLDKLDSIARLFTEHTDADTEEKSRLWDAIHHHHHDRNRT